MFIGLIQADLCEGNLAKECNWQTVVLITKGSSNFRGIALVEFLWKTVIRMLIQLPDSHGIGVESI